MLRMMRLVRVVRLFRLFRHLWLLLQGIINAVRALVWVVVMLTLFIFNYAILMTRILGQGEKLQRLCAQHEQGLPLNPATRAAWTPEELENQEMACEIRSWFGWVPESMFTLFTIVTAEAWNDVARPVMNPEYGGIGSSGP